MIIFRCFQVRWLAFFLCAGIAMLALAEMVPGDSQPIKKVITGQRVMALTFDDGPDLSTTQELLKVLRDKDVKATFFILGSQAERYPPLLAAIVAEGHEIGNHGYSHVFLQKAGSANFLDDVRRAGNIIAPIAGQPVLFRPPGGGYNDALVSDLSRLGYTTILWSIDPRDWEGRPADRTASIVARRAAPGSIVLLHEGGRATPQAVAAIIDRLRMDGYSFVTVGELLQLGGK
ncbi:hypothetical protein P22_1049 [Propionispora sp. 2/2-37]|uniref:polysaccharide deacetylase family protein n=1 Tax=Propionispora sp. 2/2-37 TaxID=1677858 RepID=UPI0006BB5703|nr:polysaccharide deacetylase family protein [Propionispora sp. 2/2-37]CUH94980.1 hypothetical protein P22_1049 [Propionispora sp. 2/2-37]